MKAFLTVVVHVLNMKLIACSTKILNNMRAYNNAEKLKNENFTSASCTYTDNENTCLAE